MTEKQSKCLRTLDIYERLRDGKVINKTVEAQRFDMDEHSIQRDIDDIRAFLAERAVLDATDTRRIEYSMIDEICDVLLQMSQIVHEMSRNVTDCLFSNAF